MWLKDLAGKAAFEDEFFYRTATVWLFALSKLFWEVFDIAGVADGDHDVYGEVFGKVEDTSGALGIEACHAMDVKTHRRALQRQAHP